MELNLRLEERQQVLLITSARVVAIAVQQAGINLKDFILQQLDAQQGAVGDGNDPVVVAVHQPHRRRSS